MLRFTYVHIFIQVWWKKDIHFARQWHPMLVTSAGCTNRWLTVSGAIRMISTTEICFECVTNLQQNEQFRCAVSLRGYASRFDTFRVFKQHALIRRVGDTNAISNANFILSSRYKFYTLLLFKSNSNVVLIAIDRKNEKKESTSSKIKKNIREIVVSVLSFVSFHQSWEELEESEKRFSIISKSCFISSKLFDYSRKFCHSNCTRQKHHSHVRLD